jgi:hypothetical protein
MNICILIPTYKRNTSLERLLNFLKRAFLDYRGFNKYDIVITDSDHFNPSASLLSQIREISYILNPGRGFDDNLYHGYTRFSSHYEYIFSISDDDLPVPYPPSILDLIDLSIERNQYACLFNHINYQLTDEGGIEIGDRFYNDLRFCFDKQFMLKYFLRILPRHAGILYSSSHIKSNLEIIGKFRGTQHLYAVPFLLACLEGKAIYLDIPAILFHAPNVNNDGAWESHSDLFVGLFKFLKLLNGLIDPELYAIAYDGFFANYLGDSAWLRTRLTRGGVSLPSERHLRHVLVADV